MKKRGNRDYLIQRWDRIQQKKEEKRERVMKYFQQMGEELKYLMEQRKKEEEFLTNFQWTAYFYKNVREDGTADLGNGYHLGYDYEGRFDRSIFTLVYWDKEDVCHVVYTGESAVEMQEAIMKHRKENKDGGKEL